MITAESIRKTVESRIAEMVESRHEYLKHGEFLSSLGISVRNNLTLHHCLENVLANYLDFLCGKLSQENADGTPAKIAVDPAWHQLFTHRDQRNKALCELFFQHQDGNQESDQALAKTYLDSVAFADIADAINRQLSELVDTGLQLFAKKMIDVFHLSSFDGYYSPYRKSGRVICQAWSFNYHDVYKKLPELLAVGNALQRIEQDAALSFGAALVDYINAAKILGYDMLRRNNAAKLSIGLVPQTIALYTTLTSRDNLKFFGGIYGIKGQLLKSRIDEVLEIVGLSDRADDIVDTYSGGMKRRLNIAAALLHKPKVLFLDEPTVGVDPQSRNAIFECIEKMAREGLTIVYTTHYIEEAQRLCQRVAIMDSGKIIALDTPLALRQMVGEAYFRVNLEADSDTVALESLLKTADSIRDIKVKDCIMEVDAQPLQNALAFFLQSANTLGVRFSSLSIFESSLETVFLKLTGKQLRDE